MIVTVNVYHITMILCCTCSKAFNLAMDPRSMRSSRRGHWDTVHQYLVTLMLILSSTLTVGRVEQTLIRAPQHRPLNYSCENFKWGSGIG